MNRNHLHAAITILAVILIIAFIIPLLFNLVVGTLWLVIRLAFVLALIYLILKWFRGKRQ